MFKLGSTMKDKATGLKGALIHMQVSGNDARWYSFQPAGLGPDKMPPERVWITPDRIIGDEEPDPPLPIEALGTEAQDTVTGFSGVITAIIVHLNGCIHLQLQPKGKNKSGGMFESREFDIRMLVGPSLKKWTESERKASERITPSPVKFNSARPRKI